MNNFSITNEMSQKNDNKYIEKTMYKEMLKTVKSVAYY